MILVKNSNFLSRLLFFENAQLCIFLMLYIKKKAFQTIKMSFSLSRKVCIFLKPIILVKNSKFLSSLLFIEKCLDIENNTWSRRDMEFIFECSHRYRTSEISNVNMRKPCHIVENPINVIHCLKYSSVNSELYKVQ